MSVLKGVGIYMHFTNVRPQHENEFNVWYDTEQLPAVMAVPGVLCGARYVACKGAPKYLALYELVNTDVALSTVFKKVSQGPADWSQRTLSSSVTDNSVACVLAQQIFPPQPEILDRPLPPALQIGRMSVPAQIEEEWNAWYNVQYIPGYRNVSGMLYARRYRVLEGSTRYMTIYELQHEKVPESAEWENQRRQLSPRSVELRQAMIGAPGTPGVYRRHSPVTGYLPRAQ